MKTIFEYLLSKNNVNISTENYVEIGDLLYLEDGRTYNFYVVNDISNEWISVTKIEADFNEAKGEYVPGKIIKDLGKRVRYNKENDGLEMYWNGHIKKLKIYTKDTHLK